MDRREKARQNALKSWADPEIRRKRIKSLKISNGKPRSAEHRRKLGAAHLGVKASKATRRKMSESHRTRLANCPKWGCKMCGSTSHTYAQHQAKLVKARLESEVWQRTIVERNRAIRLGTKASKATRKKMSAAHLIIQNLPESKALRSKCSKKMWAKRTSAEVFALASKISEALIGRRPASFGFRAWYNGPKGRICMRSNWEVAFAKRLDSWEINWTYETKPFLVGRSKEWGGSNYYPDFYLPKFSLYVEVKGYLRDDNCAKIKAFRKKHPKVNWLYFDERALQQIGVLNSKGIPYKRFLQEKTHRLDRYLMLCSTVFAF